MSTRDDDILDFDFFDEEEPASSGEDLSEGPPGVPRGRGPRGRGPRFRAPDNLTPLLRLVGLIALAILVIVLLVVWIEGCATDHKHSRYADYMSQIGAIGAASAKLCANLDATLTTPGLKEEDLDAKLGGFVQQAQSQVQRANGLGPPGPLHDAHEGAVEALDFRVLGLKGLQASFKQTASTSNASTAGQQLASQADRLLASDVVWADRFKTVAENTMRSEGVNGVAAPPSVCITTDELTTARGLAAIWQRIQGASTGGTTTGLHGTGIQYVKALPSGQLLSTSTITTIKVSTQLSFEIAVTDTGDSQEVGIKVTLTIPKTPHAIVKTATIPIIDPGETKTVAMQVGTLVPFDQVAVNVSVTPVKGETNTTNNTADYPVLFTL